MGFRSWFQSQFSRRHNMTPLVSFVLLLREPRPLTIGDLAATVRRALGPGDDWWPFAKAKSCPDGQGQVTYPAAAIKG